MSTAMKRPTCRHSSSVFCCSSQLTSRTVVHRCVCWRLTVVSACSEWDSQTGCSLCHSVNSKIRHRCCCPYAVSCFPFRFASRGNCCWVWLIRVAAVWRVSSVRAVGCGAWVPTLLVAALDDEAQLLVSWPGSHHWALTCARVVVCWSCDRQLSFDNWLAVATSEVFYGCVLSVLRSRHGGSEINHGQKVETVT